MHFGNAKMITARLNFSAVFNFHLEIEQKFTIAISNSNPKDFQAKERAVKRLIKGHDGMTRVGFQPGPLSITFAIYVALLPFDHAADFLQRVI